MLLVAKHVARVLIFTLLGGFLALTLARVAPGYAVDERELDSRLNQGSREIVRQSHSSEHNIFSFYYQRLSAMAHGDFGVSPSFDRPVRTLLAERIPVTARLVAFGLGLGWIAALGLALPLGLIRGRTFDLIASASAGIFICIPAAVFALLFVLIRAPAQAAIGLIVFPKIFRYARSLVQQHSGLPHVLTAHAKGVGSLRVLLVHILAPAAPQWFALLGVSVSLALSATIPVEVLCDLPGIGQLAWKAALARDLYLLVSMTLIVTLTTVIANSLADVAGHSVRAANV